MKSLSRILTVLFCCAPFAYAGAAGTVATTAGSNLTAFNPSNANNNQWASMSNGRYDSANAPSAKADFGNCNSLILRCAQPKCSNGGCADASVASAIVKGCVQANSACKQYGDDLEQYMTAQLVASSNAKINEQNLAAQQAAAAAAQQQSEQQMQQMQYQMQQMQQQMAQQQAESQQQLQEALAQQAAQNQAALESMKAAATEAAKENEAGITAYQQEAIDRGISEDILTRQTITGQIMTEIENAEVSLKEVKTAMNTAFEYAKCDARGNGCSGPKRVKKWRELARDFSEPYKNVIDKIYDGLELAQIVGVDMSQIYMMLNNSCSRWGQYTCPYMPDSYIEYNDSEDGTQIEPKVCTDTSAKAKYECYKTCPTYEKEVTVKDGKKTTKSKIIEYEDACKKICDERAGGCKKCTLLKILTNKEEDAIYEGWINAEKGTGSGNTTVVACASGILNSSKLFAGYTRNRNGTNLVNMDMLELWLDQIGSDKEYPGEPEPINYCFSSKSDKDALRKSALSKSVKTDEMYCSGISGGKCTHGSVEQGTASYINPVYAICDAHQYNAGIKAGPALDSNSIANIKEIVGLKTTVVSQQMYKQYEYLSATLRRLKTQLEKAALTATLETAGAKSESGSSSSGGLLGGKSDSDKTIHLAGAENCANKMSSDAVYSCIQTNVSLIISSATSNTRKACRQLIETIDAAEPWKITMDDDCKKADLEKSCNKNNVASCAQKLNVKVIQKKEEKSQQQSFRGLMGYTGG